MLVLALKNLFAHRRRLVSTALAVVLGVAFMAGTFVFADTLTKTLNSIVQVASENVDALARAPQPVSLNFTEPGATIDGVLLDTATQLTQVAEADVQIVGYAQLIGADGNTVAGQSPGSALGYNWSSVDDLNPFELTDGRAPVSGDEIVIDRASADSAGYEVGDSAPVLTVGDTRTFRIVGIANYGEADSQGGAGAVLFERSAAEELLAEPGQVNSIAAIASSGVSQEQLVAALTTALDEANDAPIEVITGQQLTDENSNSVNELIGPFRTFLLVFSLIAMFVSAFIINNTFSITVAQRAREMALLRALGASRRQVTTAVIVEAAVIGVIAATVGLVIGVGVAQLLNALISALGFDLPDGDTVVSPGSMLLAFGVGFAATVLSAVAPSRTAGRVPPIAALRGLSVETVGSTRRRLVLGVVVIAAGVGFLLVGLAGQQVAFVGLGAVATFAGTAVIGPVLVRPAARVFGVPLAVTGVPGDLAVQNASRSPKRTARTASSLMIGVGLVAFMTVLGASMSSSFGSSLDKNFFGSHVVEAAGFDGVSGFGPELADELRTTEGVDVVSEFRYSRARINDESGTTDLEAYDAATIGELIDLGVVDGDLGALGTDGIAINRDYAADNDLELGSQIPVALPTGRVVVTVRAIFEPTVWIGSQFMDSAAFDELVPRELVYRVYTLGDADAVQSVADRYPTVDVLDRDEFRELVSSTVDQFLAVITALLALAVLIALLGVANTLSLAIFERTREIGLLRAIGMTRSQLRTTIRNEAMIVALLGTALGIGLGTFLGWAVVRSLEDQGFDTLTIPGVRIAVIAALGALAGAIVATLPARRAARLNILDALADT
jgi:putative ABC transport system permease protein